jgi:uncharacterized protein (TIGR01244 family)
MIPRVPGFRTPRPDLVTGGQPDAADWGRLRNAGVTRVVNLRMPEEMAGRDAAAEARAVGLDYITMPVDGAAGVTPEAADALWATLDDADGGLTLVHCASGNRVGALLALGAVRAGTLPPDEALVLGRAAGLGSLESHVRDIIERSARR